MSFETWLVFVAVSILPAASPGPGVLLALNNSLRFGSSATLASATGNTIGLFVLGLGAGLGLGAIMMQSAYAFTILKFVGAAYLVYLGIKTWRDKSFLAEGPKADGVKRSNLRFGLEALAISLTNPKAILILAALLPSFIEMEHSLLLQTVILSATYAGLCFLNHVMIAYAGGSLRKLLSSAKRMNVVRKAIGGAFVGFAAALAASTR